MAQSKNRKFTSFTIKRCCYFSFCSNTLFVGREKSIVALQASMAADKQIMLVGQKDPQKDDPNLKDIYEVGTIATILQLIKLPDGTVKNSS
ncbi:MAG: hypothetical protein Ct9H300mP20_12510 [Gammaproteobacteria bacterium]|nr:MAG: hypothetical protein Ct9H300mP20_12510 [Gammaproteobacteria bacterium]